METTTDPIIPTRSLLEFYVREKAGVVSCTTCVKWDGVRTQAKIEALLEAQKALDVVAKQLGVRASA